jgi:hypothetical protein
MQPHFKPSSVRSALLVAVSLAAILPLVLASTTLAQPSALSHVYPTTARPLGKSYTQWSEQWWKWALARPFEGHPFSEPFDCNSSNNGQSALAAPLVERSCTIPVGTAVFLGLLNAECSDLEGLGTTEQEQSECADSLANHIVESSLFCTIDGQEVEHFDTFRFLSSQFTFSAPTPWIFGDTGGTGTAVSAGYFVMLKPLSRGNHTLSCGGEFDFGFGFGNTYHLTVEKER